MKEEAESVARSHEAEKEKYTSSINAMALELQASGDEVAALRVDLSLLRLERSQAIEAMKNECDARGVFSYTFNSFVLQKLNAPKFLFHIILFFILKLRVRRQRVCVHWNHSEQSIKR